MGRSLLLRVLLIVTVATTAVAAISLLVTQQLLLTSLDERVRSLAISQAQGPPLNPMQDRSEQIFRGQPLGTILIAPDRSGTMVVGLLGANGTQSETDQAELTEAAKEMQALPADGQARSVRLSYGDYRVVGIPRPSGGEVIVGQPMEGINSTIVNLMLIGMAVCVVAIVAAAISVRASMSRALQPLSRLAGTAKQVSRQELATGEVDLSARVPATDADPSTDVGQVGYAFNHMLDNVAGALAARHASETKLRQFVADASHELRNPLAAIRGYAELLQRDSADFNAPTQHAIRRISSESARMSSLVEDMLLLARLDSDPTLDLQPVDASEIVINAISDAQVAGPDHNWRVSLPDEPVQVLADRFRLHQVVANLLANARTHTPPGTSVVAGVSTEGDQAVISVTDDGPGFPQALQSTAFERFARGDSSRARTNSAGNEGTGLGLSIVAAVMAAHRGYASIDSEPGHTTVKLYLDLSRD